MPSGDTPELNLLFPPRVGLSEQKLFGRYTLKRVLGRGGMGIVWLAHDDELHRHVAMKFLPDMLIRDKEAVNDLKRETRRSLDLTHHHIVRIYDFTQDDVCAAIIMEYVDGETLSAMKSQQAAGCFSVSAIGAWVAHFCQALDYAHRQARVVHRDLKPANLMVNSRGDLKITDFGISRSMSDSMTRVSMSNTAGTLAYMSPEQALGAPPAACDDIYAFGATVYDLLTGRPPFFRGNIQVQLETVIPPKMAARREELGNQGEDIPEIWENVIASCLAKRPQDRPQSMGEIAALLGLSATASTLRGGFSPGTAGTGSSTPGTASTRARTAATEDAATRTDTVPPAPQTTRRASPGTGAASSYRPGPRPTALRDVIPGYVDEPTVSLPPTQRTSAPPISPEEPLVVPTPIAPEPAAVPEPEPIVAKEQVAPSEPTPAAPVEETVAPPEVAPSLEVPIEIPIAAPAPVEAEVEAVPVVEEPLPVAPIMEEAPASEAPAEELIKEEVAAQLELRVELPEPPGEIAIAPIIEATAAEAPLAEEEEAEPEVVELPEVAAPVAATEAPVIEVAKPEPEASETLVGEVSVPAPEVIEPPEAEAPPPASPPPPAHEPAPILKSSPVIAEPAPSTSRVSPPARLPAASPQRSTSKSWLPIAAIVGVITVIGVWFVLPHGETGREGTMVQQEPTPQPLPTPSPIAQEIDAKLKQALADYSENKFEEAMALLYAVQKLDPNNDEAASMLKKIDDTQRERAAVEAKKKQVADFLAQAKTAHDREQWTEERTALQKVLQLDAENADARSQLTDLDAADAERRRVADARKREQAEAEEARQKLMAQKEETARKEQERRDAEERDRERIAQQDAAKKAKSKSTSVKPQRTRDDSESDTPPRRSPVVNRNDQRPPTPAPTRTDSPPPNRRPSNVFKGGPPGG